MSLLKRIVQWWTDDYMIGFWVGGTYFAQGLTWRSVATMLAIILVGVFLQVWSEQ